MIRRVAGRSILSIRTTRTARFGYRRFSTSGEAPSQSFNVSLLGGLTNELDRVAPRFDLQGSQIQVLSTPHEFYETLKAKILRAQTQIYLSTLYIGKTEYELISTIQTALRNQPKLKVSILTDYLRGTRESPDSSCASLLVPLVTEFGTDRVDIRMYHTPNLTGFRKKAIPKRINEGWGLQHMKLYSVDDEVIISGANLSNDYFTNRQDRYHVFSSKEITEYFSSIHHAVCDLSFRVLPSSSDDQTSYLLQWPKSNAAPSPLDDADQFVQRASTILSPLIRPRDGASLKHQEQKTKSVPKDTIVYPLAQLTQLLKPDTSTEHPGITAVLRQLSTPAFTNSAWTFTAGYFNIQPDLRALLLASRGKGTIITASPWANGFYGSKGVSGLLPPAYTLLARRFLESVQGAGKASQIQMKEWRRGTVGQPGGWTYHAKGLWITLPGEENPSITLVGSSNYTKRSYSLDLEINSLVITTNEDLKKRLGAEQEGLQEHARKVGIDDYAKIDRRVGVRVRVAMWIVTLLGGAL
ncbi:MAG: CDP-diacylglycerol--glycerol-3-phosphate 3-phosphatidyltransferase [Candelina mexicana]|nr:MAG: CDP-diacylglycerol--glycerol-3-phosphate 3-phosphatidyltransferase [Candelina mexicana]